MDMKSFEDYIAEENIEKKEMKGTNGKYIVFSNGDIYDTKAKKNITRRTNIYGKIVVRIDGKELILDKIVATHFIPNPNNYNYINHIDKDLANVKASNLQWVKDSRMIKNVNSNDFLDLPKEYKWKYVPETKNRYVINKNGEIYDLRFKKIIFPKPDKTNRLCFTTGYREFYIWVMAAKVFLENKKNCKRIKFIDGNLKNTRISNLKWSDDGEYEVPLFFQNIPNKFEDFKEDNFKIR